MRAHASFSGRWQTGGEGAAVRPGGRRSSRAAKATKHARRRLETSVRGVAVGPELPCGTLQPIPGRVTFEMNEYVRNVAWQDFARRVVLASMAARLQQLRLPETWTDHFWTCNLEAIVWPHGRTFRLLQMKWLRHAG